MALNPRRLLVPLVAISLLLLLVAWMAGVFQTRIEPGTGSQSAALTEGALSVEWVEVALSEPVPATLRAKQATIISSRIMARIERISVRAGDTVEKGTMLIELEQGDLNSRAAQARQSVKAVAARLLEARKNFERATSLHQQKLIAVADLDKARANRDDLAAQLASAKQALTETEAAVSYSEIRSPIDGRVIDRFAEPGDTASPGTKLLSIYNPLTLRVEAHVREQLALALVVGQPLAVDIPALGKRVVAEIEELVPAADPGSRSFKVKARLAFDRAMLPGMYARLEVPAGRDQQLLIPQDRVIQVGQLNVIWVEVQGQPERRFVRLGPARADGRVQVMAGLNAGDRLLIPPAGRAPD